MSISTPTKTLGPGAVVAGGVLRPGGTLRFALIASWIVLGLMVVASALGLFVAGLYEEEPWAVAALRGNDLVTLVLVAPVFAVSLLLSRRSVRWSLVWLGGLLYGLYNYAYYSFGTRFNDVFLLHVAAFALSMMALIGLASSLDIEGVAARFRDGPARRIVAGFMIVIGSAMLVAWSGLSLRYAVDGTVPENFMPPEAVHLVYTIDLALLVPMFLGGGILLWRGTPWGWALGVAVNLFGAAYLTVLEFVGGFQAEEAIGDTTWVSLPVIVGAVLCALAAWLMLRSMNGEQNRA